MSYERIEIGLEQAVMQLAEIRDDLKELTQAVYVLAAVTARGGYTSASGRQGLAETIQGLRLAKQMASEPEHDKAEYDESAGTGVVRVH